MVHAGGWKDRNEPEPVGAGEQAFRNICNAADPRRFFAWAASVDYVLPTEAKPVLRGVINGLRGQRGKNTIAALDIGCSYGINAALLKYDLEMDALHDHWGQRRLAEAGAEEVLEYDQRYFSALEIVRNITMFGADAAENAVDYAVKAGLLDDGAADGGGEPAAPSDLEAALAKVDLVLSISCFDHGDDAAFDRAVRFAASAGTTPPWIACFVPRNVSYGQTADELAKAGMITETIEGKTFRHRRFTDADEQAQIIADLAARGLETGGEEDGYLHATFHLSRPAAEATARPLEKFLR